MIKGHACKIIDMSTSKTGKHGHAKCKFMAADIFDGGKHEMVETSTHNVDVRAPLAPNADPWHSDQIRKRRLGVPTRALHRASMMWLGRTSGSQHDYRTER
jgi:hypothetical protein